MRRGLLLPASETCMAVRMKSMPVRGIALALKVTQRVTLVAGLCLMSWPCFVLAESRWVQWSGAWQLNAAIANRPETIVAAKAGTSPRISRIARGGVVGRFDVPRLKLSYILLEGTDNRTLAKSIGHVEGSGLPGESGNISIAGHRNTHFRKIEWIRRGDEIVITSAHGQDRYRVEWMR